MKLNLIDKKTAAKKASEIKNLAFSIATANNTLPGYCNAQECKLYCTVLSLASSLKGTEVCFLHDDKIIEQITELKTEYGNVIAPLCADNVLSAEIIDSELIITFKDNVIEYFEFIEDLDAWKFSRSNTKVKVPYAHRN